ncbi:MAG: DUF4358 domain-containing protein, partial [Lachnospiraceae bacterium]|nr:DUF4358 domain-containing protein [Lachnospiraceae bacterium]
ATILYIMLAIIIVCMIGAIVVTISGKKGNDESSSKTTEIAKTTEASDGKDSADKEDAKDTDDADDSKSSDDSANDTATESKVDSMISELTPMLGLPEIVDLDASKIAYYYELEESDFVAAKGVIGDVALADELVIIEANDVDTVKAGAETRLESQKSSFQDYIPEQFKRLNDTQIVTAGNYVMYVCNDNASDIVNKFNELAGQ